MICMTFVPSKNPRKQHTHVQTLAAVTSEPSETPALAYLLDDWFEVAPNLHNGHSRSQSFIAGNEASVQQQQQQNAPRAWCMLVHHSNIEIDSNDSLFFLRKNRESKMNELNRSFIERNRRVLIMQLSLRLSRLDKVICYSTFCDDQFICLICISIFVISEVFEDSSLTGVGFFHLRITVPISN